jgi:zinc transporter ZupT
MQNAIMNLIAGVLATFLPLVLGLFVPSLIVKDSTRRAKMLMAVASGIIFWFFLDVMNDAVLLGVNQGFMIGLRHIGLALLFAFGVILLFGLERAQARPRSIRVSSASREISITYMVAALVALGIGFHTLGEGIEIGSLIPSASNMINAIGGVGPGAAYVLHKLLEGFVVGTFAVYAKARSLRIAVLALISGVPTIIGVVLALSMPLDSTYFFAIGGAAAIYIECKAIPSFMTDGKSAINYSVLLLAGFYLMYLAGILHG